MNYIVTKSDTAKAFRETRHKINTGQPIDRLYVYAYPQSERVIYKSYKESEVAVREHFVCDLTPVLQGYYKERKYDFTRATTEAHKRVKEALEVQGLC